MKSTFRQAGHAAKDRLTRRLIKNALCALLAAFMLLAATPAQAAGLFQIDAIYLKGTGTAEDPIRLSSISDLMAFRDLVNSGNMSGYNAKLTRDLNLTGLAWVPIGNDEFPYMGSFNGAGHTLSGLSNSLFGQVSYGSQDSTIANLCLANVNIATSSSVAGSLIATVTGDKASSRRVIVEDIIIDGASVVCASVAGGVAGRLRSGNLTLRRISAQGVDVKSTSTISSGIAGGILGSAGAPSSQNPDVGTLSVESCKFFGVVGVEGSGNNAGIVGWTSTGTIRYCYAFAPMGYKFTSLGGQTGGIATNSVYVGETSLYPSHKLVIEYCYTSTPIDANVLGTSYTSYAGGIIGAYTNPMPLYEVRHNVALGASVNATAAGRIGNSLNNTYSSDNFANNGMLIRTATVADNSVNGNHGTGKPLADFLASSSAWPAGFFSGASPFVFEVGSYPDFVVSLVREDEPEEPAAPAIILTGPEAVSAKEGTAFNVIVSATGWPTGNYRLLDGIIDIPDEFAIDSVSATASLSGGSLTWSLEEASGKLRFVYTGTDLSDIALPSSPSFPLDILVISAHVKAGITVAEATMTAEWVSLKTSPSLPEFLFDVSEASARIELSVSAITIAAREIYTGDGTDLIATNVRVYAVEIDANPEGTGKAASYKGTALLYSPEFTAKHARETYLLFTTPDEAISDILDADNYSFDPTAALAIGFGDTDGNGVVNAQDASDAIGAWLRIVPVDSNAKIATINVTPDGAINTMDALAIMEHYVSGTEMPILGK